MSEPSLLLSDLDSLQVSSVYHFWVFLLTNFSLSYSLLTCFLFLPTSLPIAFPSSLYCQFLGHLAFTMLKVLFDRLTAHMTLLLISPFDL